MLFCGFEGFLSTIGTYLPFDYVTEKLLAETTDLESVWALIYEIYDAELVTTNYLDYALMSRNSGETYRNYYNRLVGFTRQHLPSNSVSAEGVTSPQDGEKLTIALLDSIAVHWLLSIDRRLIGIIRTEFASQLKTKRLCEMIKPIATNVDELLARYEKSDQVVAINSDVNKLKHPPTIQDQEPSLNTIVRRIEKLEFRSKNNKRSRQRFQKRFNHCQHCHFLNT